MEGNQKDWKIEALVKRAAQASTVIVVETWDPKRVSELISFLKNKSTLVKNGNGGRKGPLFIFYPSRGLYEAGESELKKVTRAPQGNLLGGSDGAMGLEEALEYVDSLVNTTKHVDLVLVDVQNLSQVAMAWLRTWIFDEAVYSQHFTCWVVTENLGVLGDTLRHTILVRPPLSTEAERGALVSKYASDFNIQPEKGLVEALSGLNLHEAESVVLESIARERALKRATVTSFKAEIVRKAGILTIEEPHHGFEAVGGYEEIKEFVRENFISIFKEKELAQSLGLQLPRGLLFFGPPGTGKTLFARALARELQIPLVRLRTEAIVSKWYGESERLLARAIHLAEEIAPAIVFIDEIDRLGQRGTPSEHETSRRMFAQLLEWLGNEDRKAVILGTTNRPQDLDEAFLRVGRFDYILPFLWPDERARVEILRVHTEGRPLAEDVSLEELAERTELFSGAEIRELCIRAAREAFRERRGTITARDFQRALETFRIDREQRARQLKEYLALAEKYTNDARFLSKITQAQGLSRAEAMREALGL